MNEGSIDLHCDLLSYLAENPKRTPFDKKSRCSLTQLKEGKVLLQVLAIFSITSTESHKFFNKQVSIFQEMINKNSVLLFKGQKKLNSLFVLPSIENASCLLTQNENLALLEKRLKKLFFMYPIAYIGIVWNGGNRFAGGVRGDTKKGLTEEGKHLLELMEFFGIPVDLSHCNRRSIDDIFDYIYKKCSNLIPIASHSNARRITNSTRNLLNDHIKEIIKLKGIIGINLVKKFMGVKGDFSKNIIKHVDHFLSLGAEDYLCCGTDYFYSDFLKNSLMFKFSKSFSNSSCHNKLRDLLKSSLKEEVANKIIKKNAYDFLSSTLEKQACCKNNIGCF